MSRDKTILWIDNDAGYMHVYAKLLKAEGYDVLLAETITDAKEALKSKKVDLVLLDMMIPVVTREEEEEYSPIETEGGLQTGLVLGRWIRNTYPQLPIVCFTARIDESTRQAFLRFGTDIIHKAEMADVSNFAAYINDFFSDSLSQKRLKMFIVHGQDDAAKYELKNFIQNSLKLGEPVILHERPSLGRTIMEKFEEEARHVDVVFVLLTPDDAVYNSSTSDVLKRRARQNVILELGYFLAKLERKKGRVLLLYKGELELPSDISGLIYIDVTDGIVSAGELIRRELADLL